MWDIFTLQAMNQCQEISDATLAKIRDGTLRDPYLLTHFQQCPDCRKRFTDVFCRELTEAIRNHDFRKEK